MKSMRWLFAASAALICLGPAAAQSYPDRPVTVVTPFSTGGDADLAARNLATAAQKVLGQPVVVVNRGGANGAIGSQQVKDAAPDGYTLLLARVGSQAILPALQPSLSYKWDDFSFLGTLELNPYICAVRKEAPYRSLADLVDRIKAQPGKLNYATTGPATVLNLGPQMLFNVLGLGREAAMPIAYKGSGEALVAVLGGEVDFVCTNLAPIAGAVRDGRLRALVTTTPERLPDFPDVPTAREAGYPQLEKIIGWSALYGPKGLPDDVVRVWRDALARIKDDAQWREGTTRTGSLPYVLGPEQTRDYVRGQYEEYARLGKLLDITLK